MENRQEILNRNWNRVVEEVAEAATSVGRDSGSVTIIGVTKYVDIETTRGIVLAGCHELGESRPQSLWEKGTEPSIREAGNVHWHMIGHLQRNKVRRTLPLVDLIHSVDSDRLVSQIDQDAQAIEQTAQVLLEVNVTSDTSKTGVLPEHLARLLDFTLQTKHVIVRGIMGMASLDGDPLQARRDFATIRELRDQLAIQFSMELPILSMGMSGDFKEAIAEGSTMVRIGSLLFEGLSS